MDRCKIEVNQMKSSIDLFEKAPQESWRKCDCQKLTIKFKNLLENFKQTAIDYGLDTSTNQISAPSHISNQIFEVNQSIKELGKILKIALEDRESKCGEDIKEIDDC